MREWEKNCNALKQVFISETDFLYAYFQLNLTINLSDKHFFTTQNPSYVFTACILFCYIIFVISFLVWFISWY